MSDKKEKIVAIKGMNDILPADAPLWELFENTVESVLKSYGYQKLVTPIVEETGLFARAIGAVTDIVEKEMYSFTDSMNGDQLTLRPEGTAGAVRAVVEHNLAYDGPKRLWYKGPMFRHERPQRGRYRQFFQFGAEAIGFAGPDIDAELIMLCRRVWDDLGLDNIRLELNSIGNAEERQRHRADLIAYFEANIDVLDAEAKRRLHANPLRILDTKNPAMQDLVNAAPQLLSYLGGESLAHFEGLKKILDASNVQYTVNPRLVRGLDYYNRTVFEWVTDELGAQGTVCAGGRYDPLIEMIGGKPTPGIGFAMGMERLIELMKGQGEPAAPSQCDVYMVHQGEDAQLKAFILAERIRDAGLDVVLHCATAQGAGSFKSQMKKADGSGAAFAVIIGEDEVKNEVVAVKSLRDAEGGAQQASVAFDEAVDYIVDQVIGGHDHDHDHEHVHYHP
ncbi:histidyl-tRNA synthase [Massilia sp. WF1]|uniref:histidine--tRNA ligase n=1 Tax=unclassified Massilia TaxID=2609279 RepID=UPI000649E969|nr:MULTISPECIES: histidine--tRNA ligase [unclassified Massilia]ALK98206.1 histidine--tRNA ligase [Massilia sp. WG5]KLU37220.1 histidyl-tRNA synthase [Massilia sp. WF1]